MANWLNQFFQFYLEDRGWLYLTVIPSLIFIGTLVDNQRNNRGGIGWLIGMFICILVFLPAGIYDLGPTETRAALRELRLPMFYIGILGVIFPLMLVLGYWLSTRANSASRGYNGSEGVVRIEGGGVAVANPLANGEEDAETMLSDEPGPVGFQSPPVSPDVGGFPPPMPNGPPAGFQQNAPINLGQSGSEDPTSLGPSGNSMPPPSPGKRGVNAWLVKVGNENVRYQLYEGETIIGRGTKFDVALEDSAISRPHAIIEQHKRSFVIRDLGSRSGTFVNGYLLEEDGQLLHDTVIRLGNNEYRFVSE